jgi:transposase-like protein
MDKLGEIIAPVERRRKSTPEQKVKVLTEVLKGATVSAVADRNGISRSQLYTWKKLAQRGDIPRHLPERAGKIGICSGPQRSCTTRSDPSSGGTPGSPAASTRCN